MAMKTPILRPLRTNGATLYVFPSASEDIGLNLNNGTNGVAMSHYALLNFTKDNFGYTTANDIVKDLQNYVMNHEVSVINDSGYNYQEPYTVSEHVFWHWLMSKNSRNLRFTETDSTNHNNIYTENWTDRKRLVQCFGSIDAGNSLSTEFGMFNETYVSIPTSYGNGPVFFRKVTDNNNYKPGASYNANTSSSTIWGRENDALVYVGSSTQSTDANNKYTDNTPIEIVKDITTIQAGCRKITGKEVNVTSYDDVNIDSNNDFSNTSYSMTGVSSGSTGVGCEFNFNAILLYYSIYNNDDLYKEPIATNLFGIVFLDGGTGSGDYYLAPLTKKKSYKGYSTNGGYFGNSYSFRVNIKTLSVYDSTGDYISDNTTITSAYSQDFSDVIYNLNRAIDVMNTNVQTTSSIQNAYATILAQNYDILKRYDDVSTALHNYITEQTAEAFNVLNASINTAFNALADSQSISNNTGYSSDGTTRLNTGQYLNRTVVSPQAISRTSEFSYGNNADIELLSLQDDSDDMKYGATDEYQNISSENIIAEKLDILVAKNLNLTTQRYINLTASDINFNIKDNQKYASFSLINILEKIDILQQYVDEIMNIDEDVINDVSPEDVQTVDNKAYINLDEPSEDAVETNDEQSTITSDAEEQILGSSNSNKDYELEKLLAIGIIPIKYTLMPRAKKPEEVGYYFKQNTSGNINTYVYFDGTDYTETNKCQSGKMYTMNGMIYVFNGETCKLLGE